MSCDEWKINFCGFLEKKNRLGIWKYYWVILENSKLFIYYDETERNLKERILINDKTIIESRQENSRTYVFNIRNNIENNENILIFSTIDFSSLEAWMIALIQCINGSYRISENFCSGSSSDTRSSLILPSLGGMNEKFSRTINYENPHFEKCGYLYKQGSEIKNWKRRWIQLKYNHFRYYENENESLKGLRFIDDESKVILLPTGFDGQEYGFCLITLDSSNNQYYTLRLSASTENEMYDWILAIKYSIQCYREDHFTIPTSTKTTTKSTTTTTSTKTTGEEDDEDIDSSQYEKIRHDSDESGPNSFLLSPKNRFITETGINISYIGSPLLSVSPEESLQALEEDQQENKPTSYYINDETIWAKIARKFSRSVIHSVDNSNLQRLYLIHFCVLIPGTNFILVEVFEHQRYLPLKGWSCLNLLFNDCAKLSNCIGVKFPDRYLRRADPPIDYSWVEENNISPEYYSKFTELGIHAPWKWSVCRAFTPEGEKAWCYGISFEDIRKKYQDTHLRAQSHKIQRSVDVVRRRRWIRVAIENPLPPPPPTTTTTTTTTLTTTTSTTTETL